MKLPNGDQHFHWNLGYGKESVCHLGVESNIALRKFEKVVAYSIRITNLCSPNPKIVKVLFSLSRSRSFVILANVAQLPSICSDCIHTVYIHIMQRRIISRHLVLAFSPLFGWMFLNHMQQHIINVHTGKCGFSFLGKPLFFLSFSVSLHRWDIALEIIRFLFANLFFSIRFLYTFSFLRFRRSIIAEVAHAMPWKRFRPANRHSHTQTHTFTRACVYRMHLLTAVPLCR